MGANPATGNRKGASTRETAPKLHGDRVMDGIGWIDEKGKEKVRMQGKNKRRMNAKLAWLVV